MIDLCVLTKFGTASSVHSRTSENYCLIGAPDGLGMFVESLVITQPGILPDQPDCVEI